MFSNPTSAELWEKLKTAFALKDRYLFSRLLDEGFAQLRANRDELRLLFFIGKEFDDTSYHTMLARIADWKYRERTADFHYRCALYLYSLRHTLPPRMLQAKPYLIPLFLETTGYVETGNPDVAPQAPAE